MRNSYLVYLLLAGLMMTLLMVACESEAEGETEPSETDFTDLLTNQVNEIIIPTMVTYQEKMSDFASAVNSFASSTDEDNLASVRTAYQEAYLAYQATAVHNYFATANQNLIRTTNLFPIDTDLLANLIENESYNFRTSAQERANGFPVLDFMLYGSADGLAYFQENAKRLPFLQALVDDMKAKSDALVEGWSGSLKTNFVENGGTDLGSSISVQLNESLIYYEDHVRENKVGIPIGRLGPNDSPIAADATKIEAYYQSQSEGNESFTLALLKAAVEEMEDLYLGRTTSGTDGAGYDDLVTTRQPSISTDIKAQYQAIFDEIQNRTSVSGDDALYEKVQELITLYKSDLFPILNVQDADGANDGD